MCVCVCVCVCARAGMCVQVRQRGTVDTFGVPGLLYLAYGLHTDVNTHTVCSREQGHGQSEGQAAHSPLRRLYLGLHQPAGDGGLPVVAWLELQGHGARADVGNAQVGGGSGEFWKKEIGQEGRLRRRSFHIEQGSLGTEGAVSLISWKPPPPSTTEASAPYPAPNTGFRPASMARCVQTRDGAGSGLKEPQGHATGAGLPRKNPPLHPPITRDSAPQTILPEGDLEEG